MITYYYYSTRTCEVLMNGIKIDRIAIHASDDHKNMNNFHFQFQQMKKKEKKRINSNPTHAQCSIISGERWCRETADRSALSVFEQWTVRFRVIWLLTHLYVKYEQNNFIIN